MARILNLETATTMCSVGLSIDGKTVSLREVNEGYSHSERLGSLIGEVLEETGLKPDSLDAVSVSKGPGSYTGLRIGVSMAKGLCYASGLPLLAIPTLQAMSMHQKLRDKPGLKVPLLDARRLEVYTAFYENGSEIEPVTAEIMKEGIFEKHLTGNPVWFFGPGMEKSKPYLQGRPGVRFVEDVFPSAEAMGLLSERLYREKKFEDLAYFEPYYLKEFIAGVKRKP